MFNIICSKLYLNIIKDFIFTIGDTIIYCDETDDIDVIADLEEVMNLVGKYLILDISLVTDIEELLHTLEKVRFKKEKLKIIVLALNKKPGDIIISRIVQFGIYDIIHAQVPSDNIENYIKSSLNEIIYNPRTYADVIHLDNNQKSKIKIVQNRSLQNSFDENLEKEIELSEDNSKMEIVEKTVTVIKDNLLGILTIAVAGTIHRIGTTHLCIMLAEYLKSLEFKVAVIELHNSDHFKYISKSYEDIERQQEKFYLDHIAFYPYSIDFSITEVMQGDYDYIVFDMGLYFECDLSEFKRASEKIILNGAKEWEINALERVLIENSKYSSRYQYLFNFCDEETLSFIKKSMRNFQVYNIIYHPNPFKILENDEFIANILKNIIPKNKRIDKSNFNTMSIKKLFARKVDNNDFKKR